MQLSKTLASALMGIQYLCSHHTCTSSTPDVLRLFQKRHLLISDQDEALVSLKVIIPNFNELLAALKLPLEDVKEGVMRILDTLHWRLKHNKIALKLEDPTLKETRVLCCYEMSKCSSLIKI